MSLDRTYAAPAATEAVRVLFLRWARPLAPVVALVTFGVVELVSPSRGVERLELVLLVALAFSGVYLAAERRYPLEDVLRVGLLADTLLIRRVFETGEPLVVDSFEEAPPEVRDFLQDAGAQATIAVPLQWQGRVVAVLGFHETRPRHWRSEVLPLLDRVIPHVAAALVQAELFDQQQAALARLEEVNRLREELVATVSHELRTPLTSTLGFLRTLERPGLDLSAEDRARFLRIAREQAERLARLVDDLLELTRLERRAVQLHPEALRLAEAARRAVSELPAGADRVRLSVPDGLVVRADPDRLLQVLLNLVGNALLHGSGAVTVTGRAVGDDVELAVSDEGAGVPQERRDQLFAPFARWSAREGTGLGLAIARGIAEAHGGTLAYRPAAQGRPHAFVLSLPAAREVVAA